MCGNFIYDLMRDKAFQKYHAKWLPNPEKDIDPAMYNCQSVVQPTREPDSLHLYYRNEQEDLPDENEQDVEGPANRNIEDRIVPPRPRENEENNKPKQPSNVPIHVPKPRIEPLEV